MLNRTSRATVPVLYAAYWTICGQTLSTALRKFETSCRSDLVSRRKLIVGNWKMNGLLGQLKEITDIDRIAAAYPAVEAGICPPATMIYPASQAVSSIFIGAQDCHLSVSGAHTGCLSAEMLKEAGAWTIIRSEEHPSE